MTHPTQQRLNYFTSNIRNLRLSDALDEAVVDFHTVVPEAVEGETNMALDFHYQPRILGSVASKINKQLRPECAFCPLSWHSTLCGSGVRVLVYKVSPNASLTCTFPNHHCTAIIFVKPAGDGNTRPASIAYRKPDTAVIACRDFSTLPIPRPHGALSSTLHEVGQGACVSTKMLKSHR